MIQKRSTILFTIVASVYAVIAIFGMQTHSMAMEHGMMIKCPFMSEGGSMCQTNVPEYVTHWFIAFATILSPLCIAVGAILISVEITRRRRADSLTGPPLFFWLYTQNHPHTRLYNVFAFVFSRGILHARIYA